MALLKPRLPSASWVKSESHHLTFAFLGEQPDAVVERIAPALADALDDIGGFDARLHGCGVFPNPRHARVGWIGLDPEEPFRAIAALVRHVVAEEGVVLDSAEFKPHLTLMRIRDRWPPASIDTFQRALRDYQSELFCVDGVTLYSSRLNPSGAVHTPVQTFRLSAGAGS
jgi:2'-5' RNA ligase